MTYKTSLDKLAKGTTIVITILFAAIIIAQILLIDKEDKIIPITTSAILLLIYFGTFSFRPVYYKLTSDELIIHRPISEIKINRSEIKRVELLEKDQLAWAWRVFGVGGLFGYWGKFMNRKIGSMTWYATRRNNTVLIETVYNKIIIVTPDEPGKFVTEFIKHGN